MSKGNVISLTHLFFFLSFISSSLESHLWSIPSPNVFASLAYILSREYPLMFEVLLLSIEFFSLPFGVVSSHCPFGTCLLPFGAHLSLPIWRIIFSPIWSLPPSPSRASPENPLPFGVFISSHLELSPPIWSLPYILGVSPPLTLCSSLNAELCLSSLLQCTTIFRHVGLPSFLWPGWRW